MRMERIWTNHSLGSSSLWLTLSVALFWMSSVANGSSNSYCRISPQHTMCQYQGINSKCGNVISREVRSQTERDEILTLHNLARSKVALGKESRGRGGPQPPAADMFELQWDNELAGVAQRWADQCHFGHDSNRDVDRFRVGQNVHISYETGSFIDPNHVDWRKAITSFYDEVALLNNKNVQSYKFDHATGHYTQMVWSSTTRVGCGKIVYKKGKTLNKYLVCNYGAAGNILNAPMYKIGTACSACPFGCAGKGLCKAPGRGVGNGVASSSSSGGNHPMFGNGPLLSTLSLNLPSLPFSNHLNPPKTSLLPSGFGGSSRPLLASSNNNNNNNGCSSCLSPPQLTSNNRPLRPSGSSPGLLPFMDIRNPFKNPGQGFFQPQNPFGGMIGGLFNMPFNFGNIRFP